MSDFGGSLGFTGGLKMKKLQEDEQPKRDGPLQVSPWKSRTSHVTGESKKTKEVTSAYNL